MELRTITREIDGLKFYINQFPARKCIKLEKRTITYLAPMLNMLDGIKDLESDIDFSKIVKAVQEVLLNLDENTFENFIHDMVEYTTVEMKNEDGKSVRAVSLHDDTIFDVVFVGQNKTVFLLLLEIMKVNKFAFFELMGGGGTITGIFGKLMPEIKTP